MIDLAVTTPDRPALPLPCTGCRYFRADGSAILSAEPACAAPVSNAASEFQSYFDSRRRLLRARSAARCDLRADHEARLA